jgi:enoyl-CoA hydratase/carnithine racemase
MDFVRLSVGDGIAEVRLERGKVNALDGAVVRELAACFRQVAEAPEIRAAVLTGTGKFFSFGFDIPEFLAYSKGAFAEYLVEFTGLCRALFSHSKPLVAALNGHAVAGGCMLAAACDARVMVRGKAKIGLNELGFGSSVFAGSVRMLSYWIGERRAQQVLFGGGLYPADEAKELGLVDVVTDEAGLAEAARRVARELGDKDPAAFRSIKGLLRSRLAEEMVAPDAASIREFVEIWYSEATWRRLQDITIRG